jgi:hypothetical protein
MPMNNLPPRPLLFLVAFGAVTQCYFYYEAMHVLHLQPHRYPYPVLILGTVFLTLFPIYGERQGVTVLSYALAVISFLAGICMLAGLHQHRLH